MERPKSTAKKRGASNKKTTAVKPCVRFGFTVEKDLKLLKAALKLNPWQLGYIKWADVADHPNQKEHFSVTARSAREKGELLGRKLKSQELTSKTGTEEEQSERGELFQNIISLQEEANELINKEKGAESDTIDDDSANDHEFLDTMSNHSDHDPFKEDSQPETSQSQLKKNKRERKEADSEREQALKLFQKDLAPEPTSFRKKKIKISTEEEFIKARQDHEIDMDIRKFNLDEEKQKCNNTLELEKLSLEKERLAIEAMKEQRLLQESQRSHELAMVQMGFQSTMCDLLKHFTTAISQWNTSN